MVVLSDIFIQGGRGLCKAQVELRAPLRQSLNPQSSAFHPVINLCQNSDSTAARSLLAGTAPDAHCQVVSTSCEQELSEYSKHL